MIQQLWYKIASWVGRKHTKNSHHYSLVVKFRSGIYRRYALRGKDLKLSVVEVQGQNLWMIYSNSQWIPIRRLLDANSPLSNATISSVKLRRLLSSGGYEEVRSSRYHLLQMNECGKRKLVSGGMKTHNEHCRTTQ